MTTTFQDLQLNKITRTVGFAELVLAGATLTHTIDMSPVLPKGAKVSACYLSITGVFASGTVTDLNVIVGETAVDTDRYLLDVDIFGTAAGISQGGGPGAGVAAGIVELAQTTPTILFTAIGDDLDALTAGEVTVVIHYVNGAIL